MQSFLKYFTRQVFGFFIFYFYFFSIEDVSSLDEVGKKLGGRNRKA